MQKFIFMHNALYPQPGGIGTYIYHLGRELVRDGREVIIITERSKFYPNPEQLIAGIKVLTYEPTKIGIFNLLFPKIISDKNWSILRKLNITNNDVIVARNMFVASHLYKKCQLVYFPPNPIKIIARQWIQNLRQRNNLKNYFVLYLLKKRIKKWHQLETEIIQAAKHTFAISENTKESFQFLFPKSDFTVLYPGSDISGKETLPDEKTRKLFSNNKTWKAKIIYVGRLDQEKNILEFVKWFVATNLNMHLHIVGTGSDLKLIQDLIKTESRVTLHGYQNDTLNYFYKNSDVLILPSKVEGFGQVIIESLMNGTPVIGLKSNKKLGISTAVFELSNFTCGVKMLNEPFDCVDEKKFQMMIEEIMLISREKIRREAQTNFSWETCMHKFLKVLNA